MNTVLVFVVFRSMTRAMWRSAFVAALFALHPLHVESVAWIAERKDVLSTFFGLLAIWAYLKYVNAPSPGRYVAVVGLFALSLLSKPMLVTLPFVLLLLDIWPLGRFKLGNQSQNSPRPRTQTEPPRRTFSSLVLEKLPLFIIAAISSLIAVRAQRSAGGLTPIEIWPLSQRMPNAVVSYIRYLSKAFWPVDLAIIYPFPDTIPIALTLLSVSLLVVITIVVLFLIRRRPWLAIGWLWYVGTLIPVIGLLQVGAQSMADRYTYVPLIGIFIMIAWSIPSFTLATTGRRGTVATTALAGLILIALSVVTFGQVRFWKDSITPFDHAVQVTDKNYMAHKLLGAAWIQNNDLVQARTHLEKSLQLRPAFTDAHHDLGTVFIRLGDFPNAEKHLKAALQSKPNDPLILNALGIAEAHLGRLDQAIADYQRALTFNPNYAFALSNLGAAFLAQEKYDEAIEMSQKALRLRPDTADAHATLGAALLSRGRVDESIQHNRRAIELNPGLVDAHYNLALALSRDRKYDEAIAELEQVLRLNPQHEAAQSALITAKKERDQITSPP